MSAIDVQSILSDIQKKISDNKDEYETLLDFIAIELSKFKVTINDQILESLVNNIESKYHPKEETKELLKIKLAYIKKISPSEAEIQKQISDQPLNINSSMSNFIDKQILSSIEKNKNLSDTSDPTLHFNKRHMSFLSRIFYLQITQNYLSALKWYFTSDLIEKQTKFNGAIDGGIKNLIKKIVEIEKNHQISINELKNYANESTKWIQELERNHNISNTELENNLTRTQNALETKSIALEAKSISDEARLKTLEIKLIENKNELNALMIEKDLKTTEYLLSRISELEEKIEKLEK